MMNSSTENDATLNVYIHLENEAYMLFDGILMNLHISPYTACTNFALTKAVDQLIQQTVFSPVANPASTVPSSALSILSSSSCQVASVAPLDQNVHSTVGPTSTPVPAHVMPLHSSAPNVLNNPPTNAHTQVDHITPQANSQPQVTSPPPPLLGSTKYTFQTCTCSSA